MNRSEHVAGTAQAESATGRSLTSHSSASRYLTSRNLTGRDATARLLLSLGLLGGAAMSQWGVAQTGQASQSDQTTLNLSAYRSMASALDRAVLERPGSSASSLLDLDRATAAYGTLRPGVKSSLLTGGMERSMQSARAALSRAPADLEAQVEQARSLMRKALYDQTLGQLSSGGAAVSPALSAQAGLLAGEFGLQGEIRSRFLGAVTARDSGGAARLLRSTAARKVQASLEGASPTNDSARRTVSYLALARATGWFTVVQDAPDTGGLKLPQFTLALTQLTGNNSAALATTLTALKSGAAGFVSATAKAVQTGQTPPAGSAAPDVQTPPAQVVTPQKPAAPTPDTQPSTAQPNTVQPTSAQPGTAAAGLSAPQQQQASLNATYAALARAQAAAGHADLTGARAQLDRAALALANAGLSNTAGYGEMASDLTSLATRSGLRAADVQAVSAGLNNLEDLAQARPTSALDAASVTAARIGTPLWPLLFLIVGLLALYPLYLLNLAFGGRNNSWKAIAASLLLLFVPVLLEGLGGTFAYLGDLLGVPFLRSLGNLSLHQGAWGQPIWLLLAAGAVGLASYGFRGLCRQFGLLSSSRSSAVPARVAEPSQPALDWDEEL